MPVVASVPITLVERMDAVAENKGWNRSAAVTESVRLLLKRHERKQGESDPS